MEKLLASEGIVQDPDIICESLDVTTIVISWLGSSFH